MNQRPQCKASYPESGRREIGQWSLAHWPRRYFMNRKSKAQEVRTTIYKWDNMKLKIYMTKDTIVQKKLQDTE